jgi:hypothetical protein
MLIKICISYLQKKKKTLGNHLITNKYCIVFILNQNHILRFIYLLAKTMSSNVNSLTTQIRRRRFVFKTNLRTEINFRLLNRCEKIYLFRKLIILDLNISIM